MAENFNANEKALLSLWSLFVLLSARFNGEESWDEVWKESNVQSVATLAFQEYKKLPLGEELEKRVKKFVRAYLSKSAQCFQNHALIHNVFTEKNIPYTIIKGVASASYYPDPLLRNMGDVDFYVPKEHIENALAVLMDAGFERTGDGHSFHMGLSKNGATYELHFDPISSEHNEHIELFREYWSNICESSVVKKIESASIRVPDEFLHGFILLTHLEGHLTLGGVGLRHVCDWAVFVNKFENDDFVNLFEARLKRIGLWRLAQALALIGVQYLGMPQKCWMGNDLRTATELLEDVLRGGNFGQKDEQSDYENMFISANDRGMTGNRLTWVFAKLNKKINSNWPAAKKFPLLYPVGWVYFSLCVIFRTLFKRNSLDLSLAYERGKKRKALYQRLKLMKPQK